MSKCAAPTNLMGSSSSQTQLCCQNISVNWLCQKSSMLRSKKAGNQTPQGSTATGWALRLAAASSLRSRMSPNKIPELNEVQCMVEDDSPHLIPQPLVRHEVALHVIPHGLGQRGDLSSKS